MIDIVNEHVYYKMFKKASDRTRLHNNMMIVKYLNTFLNTLQNSVFK